MDGVSALSVAASAAQFIEFAYSLVSKSREIHKSIHGSSIHHFESELATERLVELSRVIKRSMRIKTNLPGEIGVEEQPLETICNECISVSHELLSRFAKLKVRDGVKCRRYKSFRQALKSVWSKSAIDEIAKRLESYRKELNTHMLASLSNKFQCLSTTQDQNFKSLDSAIQERVKAFLETLNDTSKKMDEVLALQKKALHGEQHVAGKNEWRGRDKERDDSVNSIILRSLRFATMRHRHEEITEAHQKTFFWLFGCSAEDGRSEDDEIKGGRPWSNFVDWLRDSEEIYWINGKAGSGKSTLMRYICDNAETTRHLGFWSGEKELLMTSFYFWNSGSVEQRSLSGLLRSLLFNILEKRMDLIRRVFQAEWDEIRSSWDHQRVPEAPLWSYSRLEQAFQDVACLVTDQSKLCLFIDGLDEFEGDHELVVKLLQKISTSSGVKVCLSSRPWLIFEEAFVNKPGLRLQDLTYVDIRNYVRDSLEESQKMQQLAISDPENAAELVSEIVRRANGVFLWVRLAVWSLLDGLRNKDAVSDLQRRLDILPSDLDEFYSHILNRISPLYMMQASQIFQIFDSASDLGLRLTVLELELATSASYAHAMLPAKDIMSDQEIGSRCEKMKAHLKTRCEGLLEVHDLYDCNWEDRPRGYFGPGVGGRLKVDWKVSYLHRTVKDFLKTDFVRTRLRRETAHNSHFDPNLSLLMSYIISMKCSACSFSWGSGMGRDQRLWTTTRDALLIAQRVKTISSSSCVTLLHELSDIAGRWWSHPIRIESPVVPPKIPIPIAKEWQRSFLSLTVQFGFSAFVESSMKQIMDDRGKDNLPLLSFALGLAPQIISEIPTQPIWPNIVEVLLRYGANPNELYASSLGIDTLWRLTLKIWRNELENSCGGGNNLKNQASVIASMLRHGADPEVFTQNIDLSSRSDRLNNSRLLAPQNSSCARVLIDIIADKFPTEASELCNIISQALTRSRGVQPISSMTPRSRKRARNPYDEPKFPSSGNITDLSYKADNDNLRVGPLFQRSDVNYAGIMNGGLVPQICIQSSKRMRVDDRGDLAYFN